MSDSDDAYGPPLPPGFGSGSRPSKRAASSDSDDSSGACGPALPPDFKKRRADEGSIGPALPPHLQQALAGDRRGGQSSGNSTKTAIGPALPPHLVQPAGDSEEDDSDEDSYGPSLPIHLRQPAGQGSHDSREGSYGPALPPSTNPSKASSKSGIGPSLPPHLRNPTDDSSDENDDDIGPKLPPHLRGRSGESSSGSQAGPSARSGEIGPALPPHLRRNERDDDSDDDDVVGPSPAEMFTGSEADYVAAQVEKRAQKMKDKLSNKDKDREGPKQRESWMTELPPEMSGQIGLTARTFRKHSRPENTDRSVWTDTPADRARKEREAAEGGETSAPKKSAVEVAMEEKDKKYSEMIHDYNKSKRAKSLYEMHQKEKKKKKKKDKDKEKPKERRPFDRDVDLQVNRFDDAQRKMMVKKAQGFNSRFQAGKTTSHFL